MSRQTLSRIDPVRPVAPWLAGKRNPAKRICGIIEASPHETHILDLGERGPRPKRP